MILPAQDERWFRIAQDQEALSPLRADGAGSLPTQPAPRIPAAHANRTPQPPLASYFKSRIFDDHLP